MKSLSQNRIFCRPTERHVYNIPQWRIKLPSIKIIHRDEHWILTTYSVVTATSQLLRS